MSQENQKKPQNDPQTEDRVNNAIRNACGRRFGVLDQGFLCQSLSILNPHSPICVSCTETLAKTVEIMRTKRVGCLVVTDQAGKLLGIFSERDLIMKVELDKPSRLNAPISEFMTPEPVSGTFDMTMAYALNLMSGGGFRHLPLVDNENLAVGIISVKDVVDYIVKTLVNDLLSFDIAGDS